jgi:hypothetical protein
VRVLFCGSAVNAHPDIRLEPATFSRHSSIPHRHSCAIDRKRSSPTRARIGSMQSSLLALFVRSKLNYRSRDDAQFIPFSGFRRRPGIHHVEQPKRLFRVLRLR